MTARADIRCGQFFYGTNLGPGLRSIKRCCCKSFPPMLRRSLFIATQICNSIQKGLIFDLVKAFSIFIAALILSLSAMSGIEWALADAHEDMTCCESTCANGGVEKDSDSEEGCCGDFCNPFQVCTHCVLLIPGQMLGSVSLRDESTEKNFIPPANLRDTYSFDFWQPPKKG